MHYKVPEAVFLNEFKKSMDKISLVQLLKTKYMKTLADIEFIKGCKVENLIPTISEGNLSIKAGCYKLKRSTARK